MVALPLLALLSASLDIRPLSMPPGDRTVYAAQVDSSSDNPVAMRNLGDSERESETLVYPPTPSIRFAARDRDLGQIFTAPATREPFRLKAIDLKVESLGDDARNATVSLQLFRVGGWPAAHDNKTRHAKVVAWTDDPRADDYLTGETYESIAVFSGGRIPEATTPGWMRMSIKNAPVLEPGQRYAFLLLFDAPAPSRTLTLGNIYWGDYAGGHAIRREGRVVEGWNDPRWNDPEKERFPARRSDRLAMPPSVWGKPDVDTWRDLAFAVEGDPWYGG